MKSLVALALVPLSFALSDRSLQARDNSTCATLHIIVARASLEAPGEGIIGAVAKNISAQIPGSDSEAVVYPATLENYVTSESAGVTGMHSLISSYETRCPDSKIALLGYSQGAQVVADVLCGTSETIWNATAPLAASASKNIIASVQMGDPTFALAQPQDVGNATVGGIFKRNDTAACPSAIMKSYCNFNDTFCDSGSSLLVHLSYVQVYGHEAVDFVVGKYAAVNGSSSSSNTSSGGGSSTTLPASGAEQLGARYFAGLAGLVMFVAWMV